MLSDMQNTDTGKSSLSDTAMGQFWYFFIFMWLATVMVLPLFML